MEENRFTWNLEDIYPDEQAWYQDLSKAKELTAKLAAMQGKVCQDGHTLLEALDLSTKCSEYIAKLFTYASCHYDAQMGNAGYKKLYETICGENSAAAEQTSFLMPELMELTRESFDRLCAQVPELALYTHYIEDLLSQKEHILDERSEQMLVRMQDIHSSFKKIYTDLRVNDTKSEEIADSQGNKLVVSDATYSAAMEHPDRAFRKEFFEKLLGTYGGYINTLSSNYYALVKTNVYIAKSRGYCSARNQSLSENFIPEEVYDNLLATVRANTEPFQRYISLRNRVLGLDKSYMYDLFLPIVPDSTKKYSFDEAFELMLKATAILGEDYTALVKRSHEERWCDVYPKQGKVSGAYSTGVYDVHPYMLLNYNGTLDDVFTLLHETGHSMHSYYSDHTQPFIYSDYTLFCAEVASTTNEMLLYHYLLDHAQTKEEKAVLLSKHLNDIRSTFYRQTMFADFENQTHKMVEAGQPLLPDVLCEIHRKINEDYYGPDFVADRFISYEWARIPHFYRAFYVYQYATGISAAVAIANRIRKLGQPAIEDYKNFLRSGSSDHPIELLKIAGVDMASPQPILDIIEDFNQTLKQLEELL